MKQYLDLLRNILENGTWQSNRTGIDTISLPGQVLKFDMNDGHPAITTRKLPFKTGVGEMIGFLRASSSAADFRALGCKVWDQNANENEQWLNNPYRKGEDDLGRIYGVQWRNWQAYKEIPSAETAQIEYALSQGYEVIATRIKNDVEVAILNREVDQVRDCLDKILNSPGDRRILFHAFNPADYDAMALPPCHGIYNFHVNQSRKELSLTMYMRSSDTPLGLPINAHASACMLALFARLTGYTARFLTIVLADAHIYRNQLDMVNELLKRKPFERPRLLLSERIPEFSKTGKYEPEWLERIEPSDFELVGYEHHPPLTAPMAV
ncbi:thymidylate synthase [Pseudomonas putida]|uniref:Thymidylate synthase n=1 Tax=Pseudomonas putida TaxID=303 RepID=A0A8I1ECX7_PSEPU|nr:thymidylate synthase [Pseudomonas putida]MBI6882979.1 thymidylate synthase [Pseudomonas putida]